MSDRRSFLPFPAEVPGSAPGGGAANGNAFANYAAIDNSVPADTDAGPTSYVIAAIVLTPKTSGIFRIAAYLSGVTSSNEEVSMQITGAGEAAAGTPIVMIGGTAASQNGSTAGAASASNGGQIAMTAMVPMSFTGDGGFQPLSTKSVTAIAAKPFEIGTSGLFSLSAGGTSKTPWPLNQTALMYLAITVIGEGNISSMNLDFSAQEEPFV